MENIINILFCLLIMGFIFGCVQILIYLEKKYPCKESEKHYGGLGTSDTEYKYNYEDAGDFD